MNARWFSTYHDVPELIQGWLARLGVRDPERGEVTVMAGTQETTYNDPVLVRRLLDAAGR